MKQITCTDLEIGYDGKVMVSGINFQVDQGDYLCIIGSNGAGKSTLMKTLLQLKKPMAGELVFHKAVQTNELGYLPQQTMVQRDFPASVYEIVLSGCLNQRGSRFFYNKEEKERARQNMEKLGILSLGKRCYRELSGGQQQRVLLARALCATHKILLLDEPVSGLDPVATIEMYQIIQQLNQEGITIIMITHDLEASMKYGSHLLHLKNGTQGYYGKKDKYAATVSQLRSVIEGC